MQVGRKVNFPDQEDQVIQDPGKVRKTVNKSVNRKRSKVKTSKFLGVSKNKKGQWEAEINILNKNVRLGIFNDERMAAEAYDAKAKEVSLVPTASPLTMTVTLGRQYAAAKPLAGYICPP